MPKRRDSNHAEIRDALRQAGINVIDVASLGVGNPDLIAAREDGRVFLIEVKSEHGRITPDEYEYIVKLVNPAYRIFTNAEDAVKAVLE